MLYNEFIEGTGCKDSQYNYKVYKDLEIMYMNSDMTKAEIYEYGKKLVDNTPSEEEVRFIQQIKDEIKENKERIEYCESEVNRMKELIKYDSEWKAIYSGSISYYRNEIKSLKNKNRTLREWFLK